MYYRVSALTADLPAVFILLRCLLINRYTLPSIGFISILSCTRPHNPSNPFCKKYDVLPHDDDAMYHVWRIAEDASKGDRFGKPDSKLILQLVSRVGWAPAELEYAVEATYKDWKAGKVKEFNICDYITSGGGMAFCASRANDSDEKDRDARLKATGQKIGDQASKLLGLAYASAVKFIDSKTSNEERHGGSGRGAWVIGSQMEQKNEYLDLVALS